MKILSENAIKDRLRNLANEQGKSVNELLKKLYLERFLARLAKSKWGSRRDLSFYRMGHRPLKGFLCKAKQTWCFLAGPVYFVQRLLPAKGHYPSSPH